MKINAMNIYLERAVIKDFQQKLIPNKVLLLLGARRVGKTKPVSNFLENYPKESYLKLNGEDINDASLLKERSVNNYKRLLTNIDLLVIDEAQHIPEIGQILKLVVDSIDGIKVVATGSSMFDLANQLGEPLVGRKTRFIFFHFHRRNFQPTKITNKRPRI